MIRKYVIIVFAALTLTVAIAQDDEGNVVEGSEVSGDIIIVDDAALAEEEPPTPKTKRKK